MQLRPTPSSKVFVILLVTFILTSAFGLTYLLYRNQTLRNDLSKTKIELLAANKRQEVTAKLYATALTKINELTTKSKAKDAELNDLFNNDQAVRDWGSTPIPQRLLDSL